MKNTKKMMNAVLAGALLLAPGMVNAADVRPVETKSKTNTQQLSRLEDEIRHELVMMPWYGVFDQIAFRVNGRNVELLGAVTRPTLRSDAERLVKRIEGVESVTNKIEVLPLSPFDDRIRLQVAQALYGYNSPLFRYGIGSNAAVRILVKNGNVTLTGVVNNELDRTVANMRANQIPGVFSVTNNIVVSRS
jgi:hyperosmotically inducible periplasmic protein